MKSINIDAIKVIALAAHGRAGSLLLQSLFDGHPQVAMLSGKWIIRYKKRNYFNNEDLQGYVTWFCEYFSDLFEISEIGNVIPRNSYHFGEHCNESAQLDRDKYAEHLLELLKQSIPLTNGKVIICASLAAAVTQGFDASNIKYVFLHPHRYQNHNRVVESIPEIFPNKTFLLSMIRRPDEDWASHKKIRAQLLGEKNLDKSTASFISFNISSLLSFYKLSRKLPDRHSICIDFHYLKEHPKKCIRQLTELLGITFNDTLLESTVYGKKWWGNTASGQKNQSFERAKTYHHELTKQERKMIEYFYWDIYPIFNWSRANCRPPFTYIKQGRRDQLSTPQPGSYRWKIVCKKWPGRGQRYVRVLRHICPSDFFWERIYQGLLKLHFFSIRDTIQTFWKNSAINKQSIFAKWIQMTDQIVKLNKEFRGTILSYRNSPSKK